MAELVAAFRRHVAALPVPADGRPPAAADLDGILAQMQAERKGGRDAGPRGRLADAVIRALRAGLAERPAPRAAAPPPPPSGDGEAALKLVLVVVPLAALLAIAGQGTAAFILCALATALAWAGLKGKGLLARLPGLAPAAPVVPPPGIEAPQAGTLTRRAEAALEAADAALAAYDAERRRLQDATQPAVPDERVLLFLQDLAEAARTGKSAFALAVADSGLERVLAALGLAAVDYRPGREAGFVVDGAGPGGGDVRTRRPAIVRGDEVLLHGYAVR
ncbi:MAG: hypothetical protein KDG89_01470 [Geminicoccaceae bacterium]|nr:hypothetical protein [Geminicoccaceae bacterium]